MLRYLADALTYMCFVSRIFIQAVLFLEEVVPAQRLEVEDIHEIDADGQRLP